MNKQELQAEMKRKGFTYGTMAKLLGINANTFWRKINGINDFSLSEVQAITRALDLDAGDKLRVVFFSQ